MASFTGSETVVGVGSAGGSGTIYTVPAGRWARVYIGNATAGGGSSTFSVGSASATMNGGASIGIFGITASAYVGGGQYILTSGQTVSSTGGGSISISYVEYNNPV
jgi:hypothetical protein